MEPSLGPETEWAYRIESPPLDLAGYRRLSRAALRPVLAPGRTRRLLLNLLGGALVGAVIGVAAAGAETDFQIWLLGKRPPFELWFEGAEAALLLVAVAYAGFATAVLAHALRARSLVARMHAAAANLAERNTLLVGDERLAWIGRTSEATYRWAAVTALIEDGDRLYLVVHGLSAIWIEAAALGAERDAFVAFVRGRIGRGPAAPPAGP